MPFTREHIRKLAKECEVELPKDFINGLIDAHIEARDAYAEEQAKKQPEHKPINVKVLALDALAFIVRPDSLFLGSPCVLLLDFALVVVKLLSSLLYSSESFTLVGLVSGCFFACSSA